MIDTHHHLIYGVDDGAKDVAGSLAMARGAIADGITHIVCTPHANDIYSLQSRLNKERLEELRHLLRGEIELSLGCEFHLHAENILDALEDPARFSTNEKGYLLVEFPAMYIAPPLMNAVFQLQSAGYKIILAHPERHPAMQSDPAKLAELLRVGCLVQITASALYGRFGKAAEIFSNALLERNWIHIVASDAHDSKWRRPQLKKSFDYVAAHAGEEAAQRLFITNPQATLTGAPLPAQPEPIGLYDASPLKLRGLTRESNTRKRVPKPAVEVGYWGNFLSRLLAR